MSHMKVIKTEKDHEVALARLLCLMDLDPAPGSREMDDLDVLAVLIENYEKEQYPIDLPDPIDAIKFRMDQQSLRNKDLVPYLGSASKVTEVLNGNRRLSLNMIRKLSIGLGISAEVLIREPSLCVVNENDIDWNAFPLADMRKRDYFDGFSESLQELKEYAAEHVSKFLSCVPDGYSMKPTMLRSSAYLHSNNKEMNVYALWAWQVRVLQKAQAERLSYVYKKGVVDLSWMKKLAELSWSDQGPLLAVEYLNRSGIHLIIEPHLPKIYLDGAVCLSSDGSPIVALTLRHDRLDSFWFTLMHELAHISLHLDDSGAWFIDDLDDVDGGDTLEVEADELAQESLIPAETWKAFSCNDSGSVQVLARELNVSPCVVAGRMRHERKNHRLFGRKFRNKVRSLLSA